MEKDKDIMMSFSGLESNFNSNLLYGETPFVKDDYKTIYERKRNIELQEAFDLCASTQFSAFNQI
jgi:hypothetical protein